MKAIKNVFIWLGRRDPYVCFEYRSASEQQVVAMIFVKQSGYQILRAFRIYETGRSVFFIVGLVFDLKQLGLQLKQAGAELGQAQLQLELGFAALY